MIEFGRHSACFIHIAIETFALGATGLVFCRNPNMSLAKNGLLPLNLQILLCNEIFYGGQSNRMMFSILFVQVNQSKKIVVTCKRGQKVNWGSGFVKINLKFIKKKGGEAKSSFWSIVKTHAQHNLNLDCI